MSAQPAETTIEPPESALTAPVTSMNFTMVCVFQRPDVELDNGLITTEFATKSTPDATPTTHQLVNVPAASKATTSSTESAVSEVNTTKTELALMPLMLPKLLMMMVAASSCTVLDVLSVTMASQELKINMDSFSVKPIDCFYIYF